MMSSRLLFNKAQDNIAVYSRCPSSSFVSSNIELLQREFNDIVVVDYRKPILSLNSHLLSIFFSRHLINFLSFRREEHCLHLTLWWPSDLTWKFYHKIMCEITLLLCAHQKCLDFFSLWILHWNAQRKRDRQFLILPTKVEIAGSRWAKSSAFLLHRPSWKKDLFTIGIGNEMWNHQTFTLLLTENGSKRWLK